MLGSVSHRYTRPYSRNNVSAVAVVASTPSRPAIAAKFRPHRRTPISGRTGRTERSDGERRATVDCRRRASCLHRNATSRRNSGFEIGRYTPSTTGCTGELTIFDPAKATTLGGRDGICRGDCEPTNAPREGVRRLQAGIGRSDESHTAGVDGDSDRPRSDANRVHPCGESACMYTPGNRGCSACLPVHPRHQGCRIGRDFGRGVSRWAAW